MDPKPDDISWSQYRKYEKRVRAMIEDEEVQSDLLLIGLAMLRWACGIVKFEKDENGSYQFNDLLDGWLGKRRGGRYDAPWTVAWVALRDDVPRYQMDRGGWSSHCDGPMIRRDGPCGQHATTARGYRDENTGERYEKRACSRHKKWLEDDFRRWRLHYKDFKFPEPAQNHGGLLEKHVPEIDWAKLYEKLQPGWKRPPQHEPRVKPTLTLVIDNTKEQEG